MPCSPLEQVLVPTLKPTDVVALDNLSDRSHGRKTALTPATASKRAPAHGSKFPVPTHEKEKNRFTQTKLQQTKNQNPDFDYGKKAAKKLRE
jgi:hypothetical protein